jgi:peptidoglycan hydrolase CwlO-like protein
MKHFLQRISETLTSDGQQFEHIVHLGAGEYADLSDYGSLSYRRLTLVEGDPEAAEVLSTKYGGDESIQVISSLISADGGDVRFHRYNLSFVNGILPAGNLISIYPRLRLLSEEILPSASLTSVIEGLEIDGSRTNLLILDLPGQECGLLDSLRSDLLRKFRFILIHGCSEALQEGSKELGQTLSLLGKSHYKHVEQYPEQDPHWPIVLLECDWAIAEIEEELENRARLLVDKATQIHQQGERIAELERVFGEVSAHRDGLQGEVTEATRLREELQSYQSGLDEELEKRARLLVEKATQIHQQGERIAELERVFGEVSGQRDALQGEVGGLQGQLQQVTSRQASLQNQISDLDSEVASKGTLLDVLSKGRVQQDKMYEELSEERDGLEMQIGSLQARIVELEQQIQVRESKSQLVDAEFQKVEGQMEIIKEIFLRERLK